MLQKILKELRKISGQLERLSHELPPAFISYIGSNEAKAPLQNYFAWNHRWVSMLQERNTRTAKDTYDFVEGSFGDALFRLEQFESLAEYHSEIDSRGQIICDFGVYKGGSTRRLAKLFPGKFIHGFDSFYGLPERWSHALTGEFGDVEGAVPQATENVRFFPGWFSDTLPPWSSEFAAKAIALYRIDCDIYQSTKDIFDAIGHRIGEGDFLLFDELIGHRGWRHHEYRALSEFCDERGLVPEYLAYGLSYVLLRLRQSN